MSELTILITGVGGPTPRSFAIALKKYSTYKKYRFIGTDSNRLAIGLYQPGLFDKSFVIPRADDPLYWREIEKICQVERIDMAIILPEAEVTAWSKRAKEGVLPCKALLPELAIAELLIDKAKMTEALVGCNVVPPSVIFSANEKSLADKLSSLGFPFWVRSTSGTSGLGSLNVSSMDALQNWIQINPGVKNFIASKYLKGRNLACKLLYYNGKLLRSACAERVNYIMSKVAPSGITGNTSFGRLLNEPNLVSLASNTLEFLFKKFNSPSHGFYTVDFKEDESGQPFITEINVRHVAFTQCFAAAGANFAEDTVRLVDEDPAFDQDYKMYEFEKDLIFLRDVDATPVLMKEFELLNMFAKT